MPTPVSPIIVMRFASKFGTAMAKKKFGIAAVMRAKEKLSAKEGKKPTAPSKPSKPKRKPKAKQPVLDPMTGKPYKPKKKTSNKPVAKPKGKDRDVNSAAIARMSPAQSLLDRITRRKPSKPGKPKPKRSKPPKRDGTSRADRGLDRPNRSRGSIEKMPFNRDPDRKRPELKKLPFKMTPGKKRPKVKKMPFKIDGETKNFLKKLLKSVSSKSFSSGGVATHTDLRGGSGLFKTVTSSLRPKTRPDFITEAEQVKKAMAHQKARNKRLKRAAGIEARSQRGKAIDEAISGIVNKPGKKK